MSLIIWIDAYSTGIAEVDGQHKKLVELINTLFDSITVKDRTTVLNQAFEELVNYTVFHFGKEEELMTRCAYPDIANHKAEHRSFINEINKFKQEFASGDNKVMLKVINFLKDWLLNHIKGTDKKYVPHLQAKGCK
jgi:hemerythrin-like metal-binding domain